MGKSPRCIYNYQCSKVYLLSAVVFYDSHSAPATNSPSSLLSSSLQLNFWSFALMFVASGIALNYWIRFKYLNDYTQLKEPPLVKPDAIELHPDVNTPGM